MQLRNFDINLLVVMEAIWMNRSVSVAAKRLVLAQSTISAALNRLRDQIGDDLFVWNGHEMTPTPLAEQLMPQVRGILSGVRSLLDQASGTTVSVERRLVVATADYIVALFAPRLLERIAAEAPNLVIDVVDIRPQMLNKSSLPNIDLLIMPQNALRVAGLNCSLLYNDNYVCIARKDNRKLHANMSVEEFMAMPHIGYSAMPRMTFSHESLAWENLGREPSFRMLMASYLAFPRIVSNSNAVALVPRRLANLTAEDFRLKLVIPPIELPEIPISMVWKPDQDHDPAHKWLRNALAEIAADSTAT